MALQKAVERKQINKHVVFTFKNGYMYASLRIRAVSRVTPDRFDILHLVARLAIDRNVLEHKKDREDIEYTLVSKIKLILDKKRRYYSKLRPIRGVIT